MPSSLTVWWVSTTSLCTSLVRLQIPCTGSLPTPHIYSIFLVEGVFGMQLNICGGAFCGNCPALLVVGYIHRRAPSRMFDMILNVTLSNNLLLARRRSKKKIFIAGFTQGNLVPTLLPNSLDLHQRQNQKAKSWADPASSFHFPETVQVFSNSTPITRVVSTPNRRKTNHHWFNHLQVLHTLNYATSRAIYLRESSQTLE